jgi:hypothetical protein
MSAGNCFTGQRIVYWNLNVSFWKKSFSEKIQKQKSNRLSRFALREGEGAISLFVGRMDGAVRLALACRGNCFKSPEYFSPGMNVKSGLFQSLFIRDLIQTGCRTIRRGGPLDRPPRPMGLSTQNPRRSTSPAATPSLPGVPATCCPGAGSLSRSCSPTLAGRPSVVRSS